jgi:uncharacterized protein YbbK (DUF523 family)
MYRLIYHPTTGAVDKTLKLHVCTSGIVCYNVLVGRNKVMPLMLISACLVGIKCRYDGKSQCNKLACKLVQEGRAIPVCPEQLGGLSTPRVPCEIKGTDGKAVLQGLAKVVSKDGEDVTNSFVLGAMETLKLADLTGIKQAILKDNSPSCGSRMIHDGSFTGSKKPGMGVTAALLEGKGILILTERDL